MGAMGAGWREWRRLGAHLRQKEQMVERQPREAEEEVKKLVQVGALQSKGAERSLQCLLSRSKMG